MRSLYADKHNGYWRNEISVNKGNTQLLWRRLHGALGDSARNDDSPFRAEHFAKYFNDTVDSVYCRDAAVRRSTPGHFITSRLHRCHR